jgi:hypothetical protein
LDDPLNLMRVMPPKGARVRSRVADFSHAILCAWLLMFNHEWTRMIPASDIRVLFFVILSEVEGSLE